MIELYPEIRLVHIAAVIASGGFFVLRGLALYVGTSWPMKRPVRFLGYGIDTVLLAAGLALTAIAAQYPFVDAWLTVKVLALVVYIGLGIRAFRPGGMRARRIGSWLAALAVYAFIISVAWSRDPMGFFGTLAGS